MQMVGYDTETTGLSVFHGARPFAFSFAFEKETQYFELEVDPKTRKVVIHKPTIRQIRSILEDPSLTKVMHNAKFDVRMSEALGIKVTRPFHDTYLMAHAVNNLEPSHGLKQLAKRHLDLPDDDESDLHAAVQRCRRIALKLRWKIGFRETPTPEGKVKRKGEPKSDYWLPAALYKHRPDLMENRKERKLCKKYAIGDSVRTLLLYHYLLGALESDPTRMGTYKAELEVWPVVYEMESRGVRIDPIELRRHIQKAKMSADEYRKKLVRVAGPDFNVNSNPQVIRLLRRNGIRLTDKTEKGNLKVDADVLSQHKDHPIVYLIRRSKAYTKALNNFLCPYMEFMVAHGTLYLIHASFNSVGARTRRFSCQGPNLQNVTQKKHGTSDMRAVECRAPFGPRLGYVWLLGDYQQLENRIFADRADEQQMLQVFAEGRDLPAEVANRIWGGIGNHRAINAAIEALELLERDKTPTGLVAKAWKKFGFKTRMLRDRKSMRTFARRWINSFNWDVVDAEKSLGIGSTRHRAKQLMFAKQYGGGPGVIVRMYGWPWGEAVDIFKAFDTEYPEMAEYIHLTTQRSRRTGFIVTSFGNRIDVPRDEAYKGVDYIMQGSASELLKRAMIASNKYFKDNDIDGHLVMTIHDEIVFEIRKEQCTRRVIRDLKRIMEDHGGHFKLPTPVAMELVVRRWDQPESIGWLN